MFKNISDKLNMPFLFGIGGIGDFLLLMSDGNYDKRKELALVFWANNPEVIKSLVKLFPKIKKSIITKNYVGSNKHNTKTFFNDLINEPQFLSKAHIPDRLDYVKEWNKINVFEKYRIQEQPDWVIGWTLDRPVIEEIHSVFAPTGGSSDSDWKHKYIKKDLLLKLIDEDTNPIKYIISTHKELVDIYGADFIIDELVDKRDCRLLVDESFEKLFGIICRAFKIYSVDTWVKTLSLFAQSCQGKETTLISSFYENSPFKSMGLEKDPGDYIFIENWNFANIIKQ